MKAIYRVLWLAILTAHATGALAWWWTRPGGFPVNNVHFWSGEAAPFVIVAVVVLARFSTINATQNERATKERRNEDARRDQTQCLASCSLRSFVSSWLPHFSASLLLSIPIVWISASVASTFVFPITFHVLWVAPFLVGVMMLVLWLLSTRSMVRWRSVTPFVVAIFAIALGVATPISQRAGASATKPLNVAMPKIDDMPEPQDQRAIRLSPDVQVQPGSALINFTNGRCLLGVQPVLVFASRSPDGCWTLFASPRQRESPLRRFVGIVQQESSIDLAYENDLRSLLHVSVDSPEQTHIESVTRVPFDTYSHLNTFCELTMTGHKRLSIVFSPCPRSPTEVAYMEYPRGRPERLAYLDAARDFHVVEASSAEKGPYHELARGALGPHDALTMTLLDEERPIFRLTFDDWAAQSSTALSPTAGYGLPENAIEFSLDGAAPKSAAGIYLTLAATSAGRGYNCVAHAAGTYRNRLLVETISGER